MSQIATEGNDRPLIPLAAAEQALALERLRGELRGELGALKAVIQERDAALKLQAAEYERRLGDLNHEAARITLSQSKSISVEKFEGYEAITDERIKRIENFNSKLIGYGTVLMLLWGAALKFIRIP